MVLPLGAWLSRKKPLPKRFLDENFVDRPDCSWNVWLSIEEISPLHLVSKMNWIGMLEARAMTEKYLADADDLITGLVGWLDGEEREEILETLGEPPSPSLPIYLISCCDKNGEEVVYIGKTKNTNRFSGGHRAALALHDPKFSNKEKKIYRATVWFYDGLDHICLDWIKPECLALELLASIERQLIYGFKPPLNTAGINSRCDKWNFEIRISNFLPGGFLHNIAIWFE